MSGGEARQTIARLIQEYGQLIRRVVARVAGPRASLVADDVEQRVIVALWKQVEREQTIEHPASYIHRSAIRETVRVLRGEKLSRMEPIAPTGEDAPLVAAGDDPERAARRAEIGRAIERCLAGLAEDRQRAVRAHLAGFDVEEIMAMYAWPYQKARNLVARGMADLRERLKNEGIDEG